MSERVQIPLRVSPKQKQNWEQYQEELGFGSREAMIRRAVECFHATQTGSGNDELQDEISTQLDSLQQGLSNLQSDVSQIRAKQLEKDDIPDIAEELDYVLSESDLLDMYSEIEAFDDGEDGEITIDGIDDSLAERGVYSQDPDQLRTRRFIATEFLLTGFSLATKSTRHPVERARLENLYDEFHEELTSLDNH